MDNRPTMLTALCKARIKGRVVAFGDGTAVFGWAKEHGIGEDVLLWMKQPRVLPPNTPVFAIGVEGQYRNQIFRFGERFNVPIYEVVYVP